MSNNELAKVELLKDILSKDNLNIPDYQRPYKWSLKHVNQLLDDLLFHMGKGVDRYRVGTVVLHNDINTKVLNIVDGQQRLVTFSLILHCLDDEKGKRFLDDAFNNRFKTNTISCANLQNNYAVIQQRLSGNFAQKDDLKKFTLEHCDFVVVTLGDISEAFQFFDSQNARGKSLQPYDLLKAFHLREMIDSSEGIKRKCVDDWEAIVENKKIKPLFDDYLYRIRRWLRGDSGLKFTNDDIDLFKGLTLSKGEHRYTHVQPYRMLESFFAGNAEVIAAWETMPSYPFQMNQTIINGRRFFEYVSYYESLLESIQSQKEGIFQVLDTYKGHDRVGDQYTRNLFNAALLCFVDRFGVEHLESATRVCFAWAYGIRFQQHAVQKVTMDKKGKSRFLRQMQYANYPNDITNMTMPFPLKKDTKEQGKDIHKKASEIFGVKNEE